jgi:hypothetical protein
VVSSKTKSVRRPQRWFHTAPIARNYEILAMALELLPADRSLW